MTRWIVGIDLGTTHTVVSCVDPNESTTPKIFDVPRLSPAGQLSKSHTLGSVLYAPYPGELEGDPDFVVGDYAHRRGREVPGRAVTSAKSWLSYAAVDRRAAILPWGGAEDTRRLSPVEAEARILQLIRTRWNEQHPRAPLEEQTIILTVPASFDPVARQLTLESAQLANLRVRLLEEPQAAFYDYLERVGEAQIRSLVDRAIAEGRNRAIALVCDVGGGTTDLTLLSIEKDAQNQVIVDRIAVGKHLLLGGDNMDLALAHHLERELSGDGERLPPHRFAQLLLVARSAKERLLGVDPPDELPISISTNSGASLVGATKSMRLSRRDVEHLVVSGFFPPSELKPIAARPRTGLLGFGLPYETDPAITRHVAAFLLRHLGANARLDAILLNGGVFLSSRLVAELCNAIAPLRDGTVLTLHQPHPELAVARGAVTYGLSLLGKGLRIGGGSAFGYYVAVDDPRAATRHAVCVVPRGSREGEAHRAESTKLLLSVGKPVRFELYASDAGPIHTPGEVVQLDADYELTCPICSHFADEKPREVPVVLEGELSAIGTLELTCVSTTPSSTDRFALAFELRGQESIPSRQRKAAAASDADSKGARPSQAPPTTKLDEAMQAIALVFGKGKGDTSLREVKDLVRTLERCLGPRQQWDLELLRKLFDAIGPKHSARKRSADHERLYFMLCGFLLRPGFGHPLDRTRVRLVVPLFAQGLSFSDEIRNWQQFFIAYRRIAAGLDEPAQMELYNTLLPHISPSLSRAKKKGPFRPLAEPEMLDCATFLERLPQEQRVTLGEAILERTWTKRDPLLWSAIGRVGARVPIYASIHHVIPAKCAESFLDHLLREKWDDLPNAPRVVVQLGRITADRTRDISESLRVALCRRLERAGVPAEQYRPLREFVEVEELERVQSFGEELPVGLRFGA